MTTHPESPRPVLDEETIWTHLHTALNSRTPLDVWTAVADVPVLLAEVERLRRLLAWTRIEHANLFAAARATLAAHRDGEDDALYYVRDEVTAQRDTLITAGPQ
ncbi:hypothetical protein KZ829_01455 [Actinoplanes hulinensis]|uniref:Uncharacterized protein n=1 Tax=Actinoplanes hulinensis TaxID=1144547 RepID=A0ABS7AUH2_9ACTN|nr:hypothetical protein [Actinoplanes hulinensis]MBW6432410.1 hypothetical protein [Actinoplanes hulinensis]